MHENNNKFYIAGLHLWQGEQPNALVYQVSDYLLITILTTDRKSHVWYSYHLHQKFLKNHHFILLNKLPASNLGHSKFRLEQCDTCWIGYSYFPNQS